MGNKDYTTMSTLELIDEVHEFAKLHEFANDEQLDMALALVVKLIMRPDLPQHKIPSLIVQLQALSAKFGILASTYATVLKDRPGTENNLKKNIYYTMNDVLDKIVDALKYPARYGRA